MYFQTLKKLKWSELNFQFIELLPNQWYGSISGRAYSGHFGWKQKQKQLKGTAFASASMYFEALSRDRELILLRFLEKYIFELDLEGCFENQNCQIRSKKFSALCFSSLIIWLNLSESMEVEAEVDAEADAEAKAEALIRFSWKQLLLPASASMQVFWGFVQSNGVNFLHIVGKRYFWAGFGRLFSKLGLSNIVQKN